MPGDEDLPDQHPGEQQEKPYPVLDPKDGDPALRLAREQAIADWEITALAKPICLQAFQWLESI